MRRMRGAAAVVAGRPAGRAADRVRQPRRGRRRRSPTTGRWSAPRSRSSRTAEVCHAADFADRPASLVGYEPVDCAAKHRAETAYVGTFTGAGRRRARPRRRRARPAPRAGVRGLRQADHATTSARTSGARPALARRRGARRRPAGPAAPAGSAATCSRCPTSRTTATPVARTGSLQDALAGPARPLPLGCYPVKATASGAIDTMPASPATKAHNGEFVGVYAARPRPRRTRSRTPTGSGCTTAAAR